MAVRIKRKHLVEIVVTTKQRPQELGMSLALLLESRDIQYERIEVRGYDYIAKRICEITPDKDK